MISRFINKEDLENTYRYERKFLVDELGKDEALIVIKENPAMFSEIFYERRVNNIYFDSYNMGHYNDNVVGNSERIKVRIRWYNDKFGKIQKPILEIKIREGELGSKLSFPLKPFIMDENIKTNEFIKKVINRSDLPKWLTEYMKTLKFALLNSYIRRYFISANKEYRITLDYNLEFREISQHNNTFLSKIKHQEYIIFELKYNKDADTNAEMITNSFPFRLTKSSKYVSGVDSTA
jgi:hypothetical protein